MFKVTGVWWKFGLGLVWLLAVIWPLTGITPEGLTLGPALEIVSYIGTVGIVVMVLLQAKGLRAAVGERKDRIQRGMGVGLSRVPTGVWIALLMAFCLAFPFLFKARYFQDVAISVLVYTCLGLGLNIVVGLCGLLDLGFIAFYGVGAYTYALLNVHYGLTLWTCFPLAALTAAIAGCIVGYPTLRMRGDYLAIVTLGFGEIIRLLFNNWMSLTNGPNGIVGVEPPQAYGLAVEGMKLKRILKSDTGFMDFFSRVLEGDFTFVPMLLKHPFFLYYVVLALTVFTIIAVQRLNFSRVGRAWEAIREDETAAELMGVNTFAYKLLAYGSGAFFGGLAGAFFAAKTRFVAPGSFTFLESALVLAMVVLGGLGSIPGIILGALALVVLPEVFRDFELYRMLAFGGAMTLMMLIRPAGLIPAARMGQRSEDQD